MQDVPIAADGGTHDKLVDPATHPAPVDVTAENLASLDGIPRLVRLAFRLPAAARRGAAR